MREVVLSVGGALIAGIIVMILHELPKSIIYYIRSRSEWKEQPNYKHKVRSTWKDILKIWKYIDPIGLLLCVTTYSGFSKPYMYRMKDKNTNKIAGVAGFFVLLAIAVTSMILLKVNFVSYDAEKMIVSQGVSTRLISFYIIYFMAFISINMILVNLIPISTFDIGLLIAGFSPSKYFSIIRNDHYIKMVLIFTVVLGVISTIGSLIMDTLLVIL